MTYSPRIIVRNTIVVGSGAAGFNAACRLAQYGQTDTAIVTEGLDMGTSRNTGSDKQTYYKLTLSGGEPDSVMDMARTLFDGQCVDGDLALCEAALSAPSFMRLAELGVPFPQNRYGEFVGYRTDHDPRRRATSVGPYTSREMTRALEGEARRMGVEIFDQMQVVRILSDGDRAYGLICLDKAHCDDPARRYTAFCCRNIVWATGGPAGLYHDTVYPIGHCGASGAAFRAGARGRNLTEWQFGLASLDPRWNVSGTYMQVLPRFVSTDDAGGDEREFLLDTLKDQGDLLSRVFLKGYQWPFDARKAVDGSSLIDLLVYQERQKGRRVYLDYRSDPCGGAVDYARLCTAAREYLQRAGACFGTPYERLRHMNAPAVAFYAERGVDLSRSMLEISLCAQHNNGGLAVDCWWRTNIEGLYAAGEAAGTHGVYRPGGSALNAGQVGSTRAARHIAKRGGARPDEEGFRRLLDQEYEQIEALTERVLSGGDTVEALFQRAQRRMSRAAGPIRERARAVEALSQTRADIQSLADEARVPDAGGLATFFRLEDTLLSQWVYLSAVLDYIDAGGRSRGSALYGEERGETLCTALSYPFRFTLSGDHLGDMIQEMAIKDGQVTASWRKVRPIPQEDDFFENVWRSYRQTGNVD